MNDSCITEKKYIYRTSLISLLEAEIYDMRLARWKGIAICDQMPGNWSTADWKDSPNPSFLHAMNKVGNSVNAEQARISGVYISSPDEYFFSVQGKFFCERRLLFLMILFWNVFQSYCSNILLIKAISKKSFCTSFINLNPSLHCRYLLLPSIYFPLQYLARDSISYWKISMWRNAQMDT